MLPAVVHGCDAQLVRSRSDPDSAKDYSGPRGAGYVIAPCADNTYPRVVTSCLHALPAARSRRGCWTTSAPVPPLPPRPRTSRLWWTPTVSCLPPPLPMPALRLISGHPRLVSPRLQLCTLRRNTSPRCECAAICHDGWGGALHVSWCRPQYGSFAEGDVFVLKTVDGETTATAFTGNVADRATVQSVCACCCCFLCCCHEPDVLPPLCVRHGSVHVELCGQGACGMWLVAVVSCPAV